MQFNYDKALQNNFCNHLRDLLECIRWRERFACIPFRVHSLLSWDFLWKNLFLHLLDSLHLLQLSVIITMRSNYVILLWSFFKKSFPVAVCTTVLDHLSVPYHWREEEERPYSKNSVYSLLFCVKHIKKK